MPDPQRLVSKNAIKQKECDFKDITQNCGDDIDSLSQVLHYLFEIMHMENINGQTFFKGVEIRKNLEYGNYF